MTNGQRCLPDDTVEPLQGDGEDGVGGACQGDLGQRKRPGHQHRVHLDSGIFHKSAFNYLYLYVLLLMP